MILQESRVPKKSMFVRLYGIFDFCGEGSRCPAPKRCALPTAPHPVIKFFQIPSKIWSRYGSVASQHLHVQANDSLSLSRSLCSFSDVLVTSQAVLKGLNLQRYILYHCFFQKSIFFHRHLLNFFIIYWGKPRLQTKVRKRG